MEFGSNLGNTRPIFSVSSFNNDYKMDREHPFVNDLWSFYSPPGGNGELSDENLWSSALSRQLLFHMNRKPKKW
ncbi:hypothetical protein niasHT_021910 [Heterodera trifolii]|uniref:Uncharacterized protein n=1 Tax=Heterodera trifolii TaxID=157864 RepID=A0ABD2K0F2_9BILA